MVPVAPSADTNLVCNCIRNAGIRRTAHQAKNAPLKPASDLTGSIRELAGIDDAIEACTKLR
jgi:hypothetical protein